MISVITLKITLYYGLSKMVKTWFKSAKTSIPYELEWDGKNKNKQSVPSGIYVCKFQSDLFYASEKMILIR